ncbi:MAG: AAA family ATPase [Deltaproteobacteria bacterium]|jgi:hypothetical protein|nr:AAA family ATPase [Deltaproteobacteria bacterium]
MNQSLPTLPIGNSLFNELRRENAVYVDKSMYLPELRKNGKFIFCARPRRFGKSLTVSALDAFYSGRQDLFRGLAAEKTMCSPDFVARPVIRLDMSHVAGSESKEILIKRLMRRLGENAVRHNVSLRGADYPDTFSCLLQDVHVTSGQEAVLLIDEYDAPVIRLIEKDKRLYDSKLLAVTRDVMQDFYTQIKAAAEHIELAFITGITKFSRMGVFSQLNGLNDISLLPQFGAFMGHTHEELKTCFAPFITDTASKLKMSEEKLLDKIRDYYDGFSFDGTEKLYNPFSVLSFFNAAEFRYFWMGSGSNTLIRTFLRDKALTVDQFQGMEVNSEFASNPGEIDVTPPEGFLYQSGYLTLRRLEGEKEFILVYPNREVREAISRLFIQNVNSGWGGTYEAGRKLSGCLASGDVPGIISVLRQLLASVCYYDHLDANRLPLVKILKKIIRKVTGADFIDDSDQKLSAALVEKLGRLKGENSYRSLVQACLWMAGAKTTPEKPESLGRLDLEAVCGRLTYVIELKMTEDAGGAAAAVRAGMDQIHARDYGRATENPILVSLAVGRAERNIVGCLFERDGQETAVEVEARNGDGDGDGVQEREQSRPSRGRTVQRVPGDGESRGQG